MKKLEELISISEEACIVCSFCKRCNKWVFAALCDAHEGSRIQGNREIFYLFPPTPWVLMCAGRIVH